MTGITLTLDFPTEADRDIFLGWLSDGGGEYQFMQCEGVAVTNFDYSYAFPAWGYDPAIHGQPMVITTADEATE